ATCPTAASGADRQIPGSRPRTLLPSTNQLDAPTSRGDPPPNINAALNLLLLATRRCWAAALRRYYRWCDASRTSRRIAPLLLLGGSRIRHFAFTDTYRLALPDPMTFTIRRSEFALALLHGDAHLALPLPSSFFSWV